MRRCSLGFMGRGAIAGLAVALTFPPFSQWGLAWVALIPLLCALERAAPRGAAVAALAFSIALGLTMTSWLPGTLVSELGVAPFAATGLWLVVGGGLMPWMLVFGWVVSRVGCKRVLYVPVVALSWLGVECAAGWLWPAVPWLVLGASQIDTAASGWAAWIGVHGVSGVVAGFSALVVQLAHQNWSTGLPVLATLGLVWGLALHPRSDPSASTLRVRLIQPGLPMSFRRSPGFAARNIGTLLRLSGGAKAGELVLWPEGALPLDLPERKVLRGRIQRFVDAARVRLIAAGYRNEGAGRRVSAFLFRPGSPLETIYDKRILLPLAESVPAALPPRLRRALGRLVPAVPVQAGNGWRSDHLPELDTLLCVEALYGSRSRPHAGLIVNLANDGYFDRTSAADQHLLLSRWRAVESDAPMVRVAATGISVVVGRRGEVKGALPIGSEGELAAVVRLHSSVTPFERYGYWPALLAAVGVFCFWLTPQQSRGERRDSRYRNPPGSPVERFIGSGRKR